MELSHHNGREMEHAHEIRVAAPFLADSACEYPGIFTKSGGMRVGMRVGESFDVFCEGKDGIYLGKKM